MRGAKNICKSLTGHPSLVSIKLGNTENVNRNRLGVQAVPKLNELLSSSQVLQFLDVRSTNLTDTGLILLCEGLSRCPALFHLNLAKNEITHSGIEKFGQVLAKSTIQELDLSLNPLGNSGIRCLVENLWVKLPNYSSIYEEEDESRLS